MSNQIQFTITNYNCTIMNDESQLEESNLRQIESCETSQFNLRQEFEKKTSEIRSEQRSRIAEKKK